MSMAFPHSAGVRLRAPGQDFSGGSIILFGGDPMKEDLIFAQYLLTRLFIKRLEAAFSAEGMPVQAEHFLILKLLSEQGAQNQVHLARDTVKGKTFITRALTALEAQKLVKRVEDALDKRAKIVSLTKKGEDYFENILKIAGQVEKEALKGVLKKEQHDSLKTVQKCIDNLKD